MKIDYQLQKQASLFRSFCEIGPKDPIRFTSLLIKLNILSVFKPLSETFSGMSFDINENKFILINSNHPLGRQNFTICHELYHLYIQKDFKTHKCNTGQFNKKDRSEYNADRFAAYLLMPTEGLLELIPDNELTRKNSITLPTILKTEQYFGGSRTALLYRLDSLDWIDINSYEKYKQNISKEAREYGYDISLYNPGNHGLVTGDYGTIAKKLFDSEQISESHYIQLMRDIGVEVDENNDSDGRR
jgi:Zn-dependent peptidase ImmA (M78 family)